MATKEAVLRLLKYRDYCYEEDKPNLTYEEMVAILGVEGEDGGNKGENSMTKYGDHIVTWYAGSKDAFAVFTFRRPDDKDEWRAVQYMSQNIDKADIEAADISDLTAN